MTTEKAPDLWQQIEGPKFPTKSRSTQSKEVTMPQTTNSRRQYETRAEAIDREIRTPLGEWADRHDLDAIADAVIGDSSTGYALTVDSTEFWHIVEQHAHPAIVDADHTTLARTILERLSLDPDALDDLLARDIVRRDEITGKLVQRIDDATILFMADEYRLAPCTRKECDSYGQLVSAAGHTCKTIVPGAFGEFEARVEWEATLDRWIVNGYCKPVDLDADDARDFARALAAAADRADYLNHPSEVRRPVDYCAEPNHDGIGGGL